MSQRKAIALFSGGKDSMYSLQMAAREYDVVAIISVITVTGDIQLTDGPEIEHSLLTDIIRSIPIPHEKVVLDESGYSMNAVIAAIKSLLAFYKADLVVTGDLGHPEGIDKYLQQSLGIECISPAYNYYAQYGADAYLAEITNQGITFILSGIRNEIISSSYIGRDFDTELITEMKIHAIDITGEDGEYQTLVTSAPIMNKKIIISDFALETVTGRDTKGYVYNRMSSVQYYLADNE